MTVTVGTMELGKNPTEPTNECELRILTHPSEPTTQQYGKAEASKISYAFC